MVKESKCLVMADAMMGTGMMAREMVMEFASGLMEEGT